MRSLWNGTLHLAELAIPVGLAAGKGNSDVSMKTLHQPCRNELEQTRQCPIHGEVPADELVKAWEVTPGEYVIVEDDELQAAEQTSDDHRIDVIAIVAASAIEPTLVRNTYFVKPAGKGAAAVKPYRLLAGALFELEAAAIVRFEAWRAEHIAAIRPIDDREVLIAQALVAAGDVRTPDVIEAQLQTVTVEDDELELARQLLQLMTVDFEPATLLINGRRERVKQLLEQKLTGGTVRPMPVTDQAKNDAAAAPVDLTDALKRSLKTTKKPRRRRTAATA